MVNMCMRFCKIYILYRFILYIYLVRLVNRLLIKIVQIRLKTYIYSRNGFKIILILVKYVFVVVVVVEFSFFNAAG